MPRNEAVCNDPGPTGKTIFSAGSDHIGVAITLPEQACRLMMPALIASGHWFGSASKNPIFQYYCDYYYHTTHENIIYYFRTKA